MSDYWTSLGGQEHKSKRLLVLLFICWMCKLGHLLTGYPSQLYKVIIYQLCLQLLYLNKIVILLILFSILLSLCLPTVFSLCILALCQCNGTLVVSLLAGYREGFLWKRGRDNGQYLSRKFILSEREGVLKYFNKHDVSVFSLGLSFFSICIWSHSLQKCPDFSGEIWRFKKIEESHLKIHDT